MEHLKKHHVLKVKALLRSDSSICNAKLFVLCNPAYEQK